MDELTKLIEEKKRIEERIKFLKHRYWKCRRVEVDFEERYVDKNYYIIRINFHSDNEHRPRRIVISECSSIDNALNDLRQLNKDITEIIEKLEVEK